MDRWTVLEWTATVVRLDNNRRDCTGQIKRCQVQIAHGLWCGTESWSEEQATSGRKQILSCTYEHQRGLLCVLQQTFHQFCTEGSLACYPQENNSGPFPRQIHTASPRHQGTLVKVKGRATLWVRAPAILQRHGKNWACLFCFHARVRRMPNLSFQYDKHCGPTAQEPDKPCS